MTKQVLYTGLSLLFMLCSMNITLNAAAVAVNEIPVKRERVSVSKKKTSWFNRFIQKRIQKKLQKRLKKSSKKQGFEMDGLLLAILSVFIGLGALALVILAQLATASIGVIILYWLGAVVVGAIAVWAGIEAWRESSYSRDKSLIRWLAFFGILFGGSILYVILEPVMAFL